MIPLDDKRVCKCYVCGIEKPCVDMIYSDKAPKPVCSKSCLFFAETLTDMIAIQANKPPDEE